jgi:hypothetical protein
MVFFNDLKTYFGSCDFIVLRPKTFVPNREAAALSL